MIRFPAVTRKETYCICAPKRFCTNLRHANMIKLSLLNEVSKCLDQVFHGNFRIYSRRLEKIEFLSAAEFLVNEVDTTPEILRPKDRCGEMIDNVFC